MLKKRIQDEMKAAMKAREKRRLGIIRLILAAVKQREVDERIELDDTQILAVLDKMVKQRRDSIDQFEKAGRTDLAEQEAFEIGVLKEYLPEAMSEEEIAALIKEAIASTGAAGGGADTAIVVQPQVAHHFFELKVKEILCKPRR